jgi:hypothetical protein
VTFCCQPAMTLLMPAILSEVTHLPRAGVALQSLELLLLAHGAAPTSGGALQIAGAPMKAGPRSVTRG